MEGTVSCNLDGFEEYQIKTVSVPPAFIAFVSIFVIFCVGCTKPLITCWLRNQKLKVRKNQRQSSQQWQQNQRLGSNVSQFNSSFPCLFNTNSNKTNPSVIKELQENSPLPRDHEENELNLVAGEFPQSYQSNDFHSQRRCVEKNDSFHQQQQRNGPIQNRNMISSLNIEGFYVDSARSELAPPAHLFNTTVEDMQLNFRQNHVEQSDDSRTEVTVERVSNVPSAATTSRLHGGLERRYKPNPKWHQRSFYRPMLWNNGNPSHQERLQRSIQQERQYIHQVFMKEAPEYIDSAMRRSNRLHRGSLSDVAGHALQFESNESEVEYYRKKFAKQITSSSRPLSPRPSNSFRNVDNSVSESASVMPPLHLDALSPDDAASNDPGRSGIPVAYEEYLARLERDRQERLLDPNRNVLNAWFVHVLDLAETDYETKRILALAIPSTLWAVFDPIFFLITVALIANFVNTDSMVAFLLVNLMIRLTTDEISGAISFSESIMLQDALIEDSDLGFYYAGQFVQLAIVLQLVIGIPVFLTWIFFMNPVIFWLVSDHTIASVASKYANVIIIDYILRGVLKMFMLPFFICGQAPFEATVDATATVLTTVSIAVVAMTSDGPCDLSLASIGWIQVIIGIATAITKIAAVYLKGLLQPYRSGLFGRFSLKEIGALKRFLSHAFPQFLGSLVELGEWDVLVLLIRGFGGPEGMYIFFQFAYVGLACLNIIRAVTAWAIMGAIWEIFAALTDGLGEAASVRVSYYLVEGMASDARRLSNKICCLAVVLVLFVSSLFLMFGPRISVLLTTDKVIQNLLNNLVGMTCLANSSMTLAQIYWSLAGAQGRFEFASATILFCRWFIIIPLASLVIFHYKFDTVAVAAIVAVGYAVAALILVCKVFLSDWETIGRSLRGRLGCGDGIYSDGRSNFDNIDPSAGVDEISTSTDNESSLMSHRVV